MAEKLNIEQFWLQRFLSRLIEQNWKPGIFSHITILDDDESAAAEIVLETILDRRFLISISELNDSHG